MFNIFRKNTRKDEITDLQMVQKDGLDLQYVKKTNSRNLSSSS